MLELKLILYEVRNKPSNMEGQTSPDKNSPFATTADQVQKYKNGVRKTQSELENFSIDTEKRMNVLLKR